MQRRAQPSSGFVLLMTLAVLTLTAMVLAGIARFSLRISLNAVEAERDCQLRWGMQSCRHTLLSMSLDHLRIANEVAADTPAAEVDTYPQVGTRAAFRLGELSFQVVLADEDAKCNVNLLLKHTSQLRTEEFVRKVLDSALASSVRLRPISQANTTSARVINLGQVLDLTKVDEASMSLLPNIPITCWGDARLSFWRADKVIFEEVARLVVRPSQASRLAELREENSPKAELTYLFAQLGLNGRELAQLTQLFKQDSTSVSLWIEARSSSRSWRRMYAAQIEERNPTEAIAFSW